MNQTAFFSVEIQDVDFNELKSNENYFCITKKRQQLSVSYDFLISKVYDDITHVLIKKELHVNSISEYQLCPKCNGDGHLGRYNFPAFASTNSIPQCDVCNGNKTLIKPVLPVNEPLKTAAEILDSKIPMTNNWKMETRINILDAMESYANQFKTK